MNAPRDYHASLLADRVLIGGGYGTSGALASSEIYDLTTGKWSTADTMNVAYGAHLHPPAPAELSWRQRRSRDRTSRQGRRDLQSDQGRMVVDCQPEHGSSMHTATATLLPNGKVMVARRSPGPSISS